MREGRQVRHVFGGEDWPCVVLTARGPLPAAFSQAGWVPSANPVVWIRTGSGP